MKRAIGHVRGFTLIEMMIAITIMALLVSAAALSFSRPVASMRKREAVETVSRFDEMARQQARKQNAAVQLVFSVPGATLERRAGGQVVQRMSLAGGFVIDRLRMAGRDVDAENVMIDCSALGLTATYAVHLKGADSEQWMVVAGLSGQVTLVSHENEVDSIFRLQASRRNAH
jgi:prepilin-type N-terminal cleavage/methylation domain-containing protein